MTSPPGRHESVDDLRAALRRNHPELSDADIDRLLTGEPPRYDRQHRRSRPFIDNRGKREARYETPSTGRTTPSRRPDPDSDDNR